jgi:hypothetical protein
MNQGNNDEGNLDNNNKHNSPLSPWLESSALVSTLTRLNQKWESSKSKSSKNRPEWKKLFLSDSSNDSKTESQKSKDESYNSDSNFVYLMEPLNNVKPTMIILFTGGAILGQV